MKRTYIQPAIEAMIINTDKMMAASDSMRMMGEYGSSNETENGGAGILSRRGNTLWNDCEEEF